MCEEHSPAARETGKIQTVAVENAANMVLAHDITEIRPGDFKGRAFRKGHVVKKEDICHLQRLGKRHLYILNVGDDELHENDAAKRIAEALCGEGVIPKGEPMEGKVNLVARHDGLLKVDRDALTQFNLLGEVMCATRHTDTRVQEGDVVAGTRAIPLVVKRKLLEKAVDTAIQARSFSEGTGVVSVKRLRRPRAGVVITGNEVYSGLIRDAFAPVIREKIEGFGGRVVGLYYAPDDKTFIRDRLLELLEAGADLLITTGGMSVDPDDVTRFAIQSLGARDIVYGSAVLPGAMFLAANLERKGTSVPVIGIPACGMYAKTTVFDLLLPRLLAGENLGRRELAELGHGGLCLQCPECRYPVCPFGKH